MTYDTNLLRLKNMCYFPENNFHSYKLAKLLIGKIKQMGQNHIHSINVVLALF